MAGIREAGGEDVPLSPEEIVQVADALADRIFVFPQTVRDATGFIATRGALASADAGIGAAARIVPAPDDSVIDLLKRGLAAGGAQRMEDPPLDTDLLQPEVMMMR